MTADDQPRVLLVDDNQDILDRAAAILSTACTVVGAVRDGAAALESVHGLRPDVLVLDISMPGMSGLEVAGRLRRAGSTIPIVFLTIYDDEELLLATQAAGGIGFVVKTMIPSDLIVAITEACAGRRYVSRLL
jgi:CheY-like chemotaxis protein